MKLYFDIGNTNIKLNFVDKESKYVSFSSRDNYTVDKFYSIIPEEVKRAKISKVMISSVVPRHSQIVEGLSKKYFKLEPLVVSKRLRSGVQLKIDDPKSLGSDLVALSAFASTIGTNVIIVNLGTATTFIHVKDKALNGAIIMPGIMTQVEGLVSKAAKIGDIRVAYEEKHIGKNNQEAISLGVINSHIFAIEGHIKRIDPGAKVIISGGNMKYVTPHLKYESVKEATIEGMKVLEAKNEK